MTGEKRKINLIINGYGRAENRRSRFARILVILGAVFLVILLIVLAKPSQARGIRPLGINFVELTNDLQQLRMAECIVSNSNAGEIWFWPVTPQVKSNGNWPEKLVMLPRQYTVLMPKQTAQFTVACPTNAESWRVPVFWVLPPPRDEWVKDVVRQNWAALRKGVKLPGIRIGWGITEAWTNYSPEVTR